MKHLATSATFLFLLSGLLSAGDVSVFLGPPGGTGDVWVGDETGGLPSSPPGLQGIRFLPLDFAGRTRFEELLADRPRRRDDVPGGARLVLPAGQGSLYRYARGTEYGFLVVGTDGRARSVFTRPGSGPAGDVDPFLATVSVAVTGDAMLVATTPAAGGDLFEVDLIAGTAEERTSALPPETFSAGGLRLFASFGVAVCGGDVLRFDRAPGSGAQPVPFPAPQPVWFVGDVVGSADGLFAATVAGAGPSAGHVWAFGAAGSARQVTKDAGQVCDAGFGTIDGPFLALSTDGSWCAWTTEIPTVTGSTREAWIGRTLPTPADDPEQLTKDGAFLDTLDQTGGLLFLAGTRLLLSVGELSDPADPAGGMDKLDFYLVDAGAGPGPLPSVTNLSLTSGSASPPFQEGSLKSEDGVYVTPDKGSVVLVSRDSGDGDLFGLKTDQVGLQTLLADVKELGLIESVGDQLVLSVLRDTAADERQLVDVPADLSAPATVLVTLPTAAVLGSPAPGPGGWLALVGNLLGAEYLVRVHPATDQLGVLSTTPYQYGPTVAWTPGGSMFFTVGAVAAAPFYALWPLGGPAVLLDPGTFTGHVLPGA